MSSSFVGDDLLLSTLLKVDVDGLAREKVAAATDQTMDVDRAKRSLAVRFRTWLHIEPLVGILASCRSVSKNDSMYSVLRSSTPYREV